MEEQNKEVEIATGYRLPHCRDSTNLRFRIHAAALQTYGGWMLQVLGADGEIRARGYKKQDSTCLPRFS